MLEYTNSVVVFKEAVCEALTVPGSGVRTQYGGTTWILGNFPVGRGYNNGKVQPSKYTIDSRTPTKNMFDQRQSTTYITGNNQEIIRVEPVQIRTLLIHVKPLERTHVGRNLGHSTSLPCRNR